jgi:hypothetical protein
MSNTLKEHHGVDAEKLCGYSGDMVVIELI